MGDPDKGHGPSQPGGWIYHATSYLEEAVVFEVGKGLPAAQKAEELKKQLAAGIPVFICPSRRSMTTLSARNPNGLYTEVDTSGTEKPPYNAGIPDRLAKTDYAINGGSGASPSTQTGGYPPNAAPPLATDCGGGGWPNCPGWLTPPNDNDSLTIAKNFNGVSTRCTGAKIAQIVDGTSKTALVGEKALPPKFYDTGYGEGPNYDKWDGGDNNSMYQGYDYDNTRWIGGVPEQDNDSDGFKAGHHAKFGGPHAGAMNMSFCDGSVQAISYDIDDYVWGGYGSRNNDR
jgi:prepilin-type processing-associated H-X9-DG protein